MKKLLILQDVVASPWGERLHDAFGENLESAFLHGNCLHEGFDAIHEPWQVSLILQSALPQDLDIAHKLIRQMNTDGLRFGFFFSKEFIASQPQSYPLEFLHIANKNVPLYGPAPLKGFLPGKDALAAECKRELESRSLHLCREYANIQAGSTPMDFFISADSEILPVLYGIFYLQKDAYPQSREEVFSAFPKFEIREPALDPKENPKRANAYLEAVREQINFLG